MPHCDTATCDRLTSAKSATALVCVEDKSKLRVKVASSGYHSDWHVQFPRNLRAKGARYVVTAVRESDRRDEVVQQDAASSKRPKPARRPRRRRP